MESLNMRVLLLKTSSMGDLIHTLPALTDAGKAIPGIRFDWVVEDGFHEIPAWHPQVERVIPVALRRWRKNLFSATTRTEWRAMREALKQQSYDLVIDAQGLVKSAFVACFAKGPRAGLDFRSARESLAALAYHHKYTVNFYQHAVLRMRSLFSQALGYALPPTTPDFGLDRQRFHTGTVKEDYVVFLHSTTWASKQWPEEYWQELACLAQQDGLRIKINGGNEAELARAARIAATNPAIDLLPRLTIRQMAELLSGARAAVAVDTGFGHLAGALALPTVSIYGSTNPDYTGALGQSSIQLRTQFACAPCLKRNCDYREAAVVTPACYGTLPPKLVWDSVRKLMR
jgi:heptosyltransferase-1